MPLPEEFRLRLRAALQRRGRRPRLRKPPRMLRAAGVERSYRRALLGVVDQLQQLWEELVLPHLENLAREAAAERPTSNARRNQWPEEAARLVETLRLTYERRRPDPERLAEGFSQSIGAWNNREWRKVLQATVGVNLFQAEPWLRPELKAWAQVNANLITSLEEAGIREVERWTIQGLRTGQRHEEITKKIEDVFGRELSDKLGPSGMRARAKLIARDQVAKLNADLTERRQTAAGVTEYIWRTSLDERVRGNPTGLYPKAEPSHWDREGKTFQWSKPPSDGHPGQPINCRCTAEPVLSGLVEEALGEAG